MELTKPSGLVSQSVCMSPPWCRHLPLRCRHRCRHPHWVSTPSLCRCRHQCQHQHFSGISVLSTYSYHPFISTTIYPKILSNLLNLSCYMELLNLSGFIFFIRPCQLRRGVLSCWQDFCSFSYSNISLSAGRNGLKRPEMETLLLWCHERVG